jgi:hypothetical protein
MKFAYGDKVTIVGGWYDGHIGTVIGYIPFWRWPRSYNVHVRGPNITEFIAQKHLIHRD